jgi:TonB family protein
MAMNAILVTGLTILAASSTFTPTPSVAADACTPHILQSDTRFPLRSQMRGHKGTVFLNVIVDESGRAKTAELHRSSGFRLLDQAATKSVIDAWQFDVSTCERKDLPATRLVAVEYRNDEY